MKACRVTGCPKTDGKGGDGYCSLHWARVKRWGSPGPVGHVRPPGRSTAERIYSRLIEVGECWVWTGAPRNGYGAVGMGQSVIYVHRWVYEDMVGEIPEGLVIDHSCLNRLCANPAHLEPVTRAINNARGGLTSGERRVA